MTANFVLNIHKQAYQLIVCLSSFIHMSEDRQEYLKGCCSQFS
jgi:hypothetical protein